MRDLTPGMTDFDYDAQSREVIDPVDAPCPICETPCFVAKPCKGGFFNCWERGRAESREHVDCHCQDCGWNWTVEAPGD